MKMEFLLLCCYILTNLCSSTAS